MKIVDHTGSASFSFTNSDAAGRYFDILIVKESFSFDDDFNLQRRPEPDLIVFADTYHGDPTASSMHTPSDVVPFKPKGDITLSATTHAPGGHASDGWSFGIDATGLTKTAATMFATGHRAWTKQFRGWVLPDPTPTKQVKVRYENAYGGAVRDPKDQIRVLETNPVGCGWFGSDNRDQPLRLDAPQILRELDDVDNRRALHVPAGLGPIGPAWMPRRPLGGTYDDTWSTTTAPFWAQDYDFAFHNSAPKALQHDAFFEGRETITLRNLRPEADAINFALPGTVLVARATSSVGTTDWRMNADTVYLDTEPDWPGACLVTLTWRIVFAPQSISEVAVFRTSPADDQWQNARPAPHPHDIAIAA